MGSSTRTYGGRSAQQRRDERRRRLLDTAFDIWGNQGWAAVTMRGVCAQAGLIDRYFYESFADREALLVAVWDEVRDEVVARVSAVLADTTHVSVAEQLHAAVSSLVGYLVDDPMRARIALGDHAGSAVLEQRRHETLLLATEILLATGRARLRPDVDEKSLRMTTMLGIGGFFELVVAWHAGLIECTPHDLAEHAAQVGATLAAQYLP